MVERYRRKGRQKLMGNHQKCWIWGRNSVLETLRAGKWVPYEILCSSDCTKEIHDEIVQKSELLNIPVKMMVADEIENQCHTREHQGLAAKMPSFPYSSPEFLSGKDSLDKSLVLLLDSIQDAHNFGAIIRTAEVLGCTGVVIGKNNQCGVTSQVVRSSAGAVNHIPVVQVEDITLLLTNLKNEEYTIVAATEKAEQNLDQFQFSNKTILIIGNEGSGISEELLSQADNHVAIAQVGKVDSLNAAISASMFMYEFHRQIIST